MFSLIHGINLQGIMNKSVSITILLLLSGNIIQSCSSDHENITYDKWNIQGTVLSSRPDHFFDNIAVKDPSIVYFQNKYHLFYTTKKKDDTGKIHTGCGYTSAQNIKDLNQSKRYNIDSITGCNIIAPQIFYFKPHKLWYLVGHTNLVENDLSILKPVYLTNKNIENVYGWTEAKEMKTGKSDDDFWIDFWVICNDRFAYMFYSNQEGSVYRISCPLKDFPEGFFHSSPEVALHENHLLEEKAWKMFEAVHIYYVKAEKKYLALLEGAYKHPVRNNDVDARNRFIFGMTADSLNGDWKRIVRNKNVFLAEARNLFIEDRKNIKYSLISHPELIRAGYDQKLEIEDYNLRMLFQTFDSSNTPDSYNYNELPWELVLSQNY